METLITNIAFILASYFIGSIPFCYLIAKIKKTNLTRIGDRNPGGWNLVFNVSKTLGLIGIILDVLKGFLPYILILNYTGSEFVALVAGCAVIAGHNYSPFLRFSGGKGLASLMGLLLAIHPISVIFFAIGILMGMVFIKNMIWGVTSGLLTVGSFLVLYLDSFLYIIFGLLLFLIMIPKYLNHSLPFGTNFKFRKEKTLKDLFTPKIR